MILPSLSLFIGLHVNYLFGCCFLFATAASLFAFSYFFFQINLRHGINDTKGQHSTCTACAGTMLMEFAALSRLTGNPEYEVFMM